MNPLSNNPNTLQEALFDGSRRWAVGRPAEDHSLPPLPTYEQALFAKEQELYNLHQYTHPEPLPSYEDSLSPPPYTPSPQEIPSKERKQRVVCTIITLTLIVLTGIAAGLSIWVYTSSIDLSISTIPSSVVKNILLGIGIVNLTVSIGNLTYLYNKYHVHPFTYSPSEALKHICLSLFLPSIFCLHTHLFNKNFT